jgi:hypothetical protein
MKHEWEYLLDNVRVCSQCSAIQEHVTDYSWMRGWVYRWTPPAGLCHPLTDQEEQAMLDSLGITVQSIGT